MFQFRSVIIALAFIQWAVPVVQGAHAGSPGAPALETSLVFHPEEEHETGTNILSMVQLAGGDLAILGGDGVVRSAPVSGSTNEPFSVSVDSLFIHEAQHLLATRDGGFLVAHHRNSTHYLSKYDTQGRPAVSFIERPLKGAVRSMIETPDNGIVIQSDGHPDGARLYKLKADGQPDPTFRERVRDPYVYDSFLAPQHDSMILVGLYWGTPETRAGLNNFSRLLPSGEMDPAFASASSNWFTVASIALDRQQRIYLAGYLREGDRTSEVFTRLKEDGDLDPAFPVFPGAARILAGLPDDSVAVSRGRLVRWLPSGEVDTNTFTLVKDPAKMHVLSDGRLVLQYSSSYQVGRLHTYRALLRIATPVVERPEADAEWQITLTRTGDLREEVRLTPTLDYLTDDVSATVTPREVVFSPGESNAVVTVRIADDVIRNNAPKRARLSFATPAEIFAETATLVTQEDDLGFRLEPEMGAAEESGSFVLRIYRPTSARITCSIDYETFSSTARDGVDFVGARGTLVFSPDDDSREIRVPIINNTVTSPNRAFDVVLSNPTGGVSLSGTERARVAIIDNEKGYFLGHQPLFEGAGVETLTVHRLGDFDVSSVVTVSSIDDAAQLGVDFTLLTNIVRFAPGQTMQFLPIQIIDDQAFRNVGAINLALTSASPAVPVHEFSRRVSLPLIDDDRGYSMVLPEGVLEWYEGERHQVKIRRAGDYNLRSTVQFSIAGFAAPLDGPELALEAFDITSMVTNVTFAPGESERIIEIALPDDTEEEGIEQFEFALRNLLDDGIPADSETKLGVIYDDDLIPAQIHPLGLPTTTQGQLFKVLPLPGGKTFLGVQESFIYRVDHTAEIEVERQHSSIAATADEEGNVFFVSPYGAPNIYVLRARETAPAPFATVATPWQAQLFAETGGKLLAASGDGLVRFLPSGQPDPEFNPPKINAMLEVVAHRPGAEIYVRNYLNEPADRFVRLRSDGSRDSSFAPAADMYLINAQIDSGGRILGWQYTGEPDKAILIRLTRSGAIDPQFSTITTSVTAINAWVLDQDDSIYLIASSHPGRYQLLLFRPDGERETRTPPAEVLVTADNFPGSISSLRQRPDQPRRFLVGGAFTKLNGSRTFNFADISLPPLGAACSVHPRSLVALESALTHPIQLTRAIFTHTLTLSYHTEDISAQSGIQYQGTSGTITFAPGQQRAFLPVGILDDSEANADRFFKIVLAEAPADLTESTEFTIRIRNEDPGLIISRHPLEGFVFSPTGIDAGIWYLSASEDLRSWRIFTSETLRFAERFWFSDSTRHFYRLWRP